MMTGSLRPGQPGQMHPDTGILHPFIHFHPSTQVYTFILELLFKIFKLGFELG